VKEVLKELKEITKECREDMHEPDEQGIEAFVKGQHFDNAGVPGEYYLVLCLEDQRVEINLATLVALARKAVL